MVLGLMTKKYSPSPTPIGGLDYFDSWAEIHFVQIRLFRHLDTPRSSAITDQRGVTGYMGCFSEYRPFSSEMLLTQGDRKP